VPADAYYCAGFKTNFATVIPSLDLVIVRLQNGPTPWGDAVFRNINSKVVSAVVAEGGGNAAPTVQITSPSEGAGFAAGDTITIAAASADADGSVVRVEFFANGTPVGVATAAPYTVTWPDVAAGNYALTARSTDDLGANTTSVGVSVTVAAAAPGNSAPSALITSPAPGASFAEGTSIAITADAADTDGSVTRVEFFAGTTPLGTVTAAPYTVVWSDAPAGVHVLTARSTDDLGATTTSAGVSVTVASPPNAPPSAQITSPANGASFVGGASVTITAAATDTDGSVTQVQFFAGSMLVGTATSAPYTVTWNNVPVGSHALTARSRDDAGATTTSGVVSISVAAGTGNLAPTVRITSPTANATFRAGGSITLAATASDADGRVAKVTFYAGTNHLYTDTAAPYGYTWRNVPAGSYRIMARATDNLGKKTSTALTIAVTN
jgi:hypothetical protein